MRRRYRRDGETSSAVDDSLRIRGSAWHQYGPSVRLGDSQERAAKARAEVAPLVVTRAELGEDLVGVGEGRVVAQPRLDLADADLRVELDAPGEVAETE